MSGQPLPGYNYFRNHGWFIFQYISDVAGTKIDDVTGKNRWQQHNFKIFVTVRKILSNSIFLQGIIIFAPFAPPPTAGGGPSPNTRVHPEDQYE